MNNIKNKNISDRNKNIFRLLLLILPYSSALYFFSFNTPDPDLWGHIKFGQDLWVSGKIPEFDIYSYTVFGREWINHEWLSELVMYGVYVLMGSPGLLILKLMAGITALFIMTRITLHRTFNPIAFSLCMTLSAAIMSPGFMIRPQLITFLFAAYFLYVFHMYLERNRNLLWSLPVIMIIWVNSHGGFLIGAGLFPSVIICEIVNCLLKGKALKHIYPMLLWLVVTELSILLNPYGVNLLFFLHDSLSVSREISEWSSISIFDYSYFRFKIMMILVFVSLFIRARENRYWEIGIIIIALIYSLKYERHTPVFAVFAAPFICEKISALAGTAKIYKKMLSMQLKVLLIILTVCLIGYQVYDTSNKYIKSKFNIIVDPGIYPIYAVKFLKDNGIKGNIMLPFEWGEYAIWKLYPDCKVSIDGRFRTVYPQQIIDDHFEAGISFDGWKKLIDKYPAGIILARRNHISERFINRSYEWIYVYSDPLSIVFIKDNMENKRIINNFKKGFVYSGTTPSINFP
jgi:hypothetical protein